jgi:hypothetical protein
VGYHVVQLAGDPAAFLRHGDPGGNLPVLLGLSGAPLGGLGLLAALVTLPPLVVENPLVPLALALAGGLAGVALARDDWAAGARVIFAAVPVLPIVVAFLLGFGRRAAQPRP